MENEDGVLPMPNAANLLPKRLKKLPTFLTTLSTTRPQKKSATLHRRHLRIAEDQVGPDVEKINEERVEWVTHVQNALKRQALRSKAAQRCQSHHL